MSEHIAPAQQPSSPDARLQRKRAARACDQCRRRKSRCDGEMHCSACRTIGLQCSFGHKVKQTRGPAYVAHLEKRVADLEGQLRRASRTSEADVDDIIAITHNSATNSPFESTHQSLPSISSKPSHSSANDSFTGLSDPSYFSANAQIQDSERHQMVIDAQDQALEYVDTITTEPRGKPFGLDMLRQLCNFANSITLQSGGTESPIKLVEALNNSGAIDAGLKESSGSYLPSKQESLRLIGVAFAEAFHLWPFVDRMQVDATLYRLYNTNQFGRERGDRDELALIYALLALGQRSDLTAVGNNDNRKQHGLSYFNASRAMVPLTNCDRSLQALQTVLCMALYLKSASDQEQVHAHVTAAASAALRMGLHEQTPFYAQEESALRQRVWSTIRVLDTYVSATLGIPHIVPFTNNNDMEAFPSLPSGSNAELAAANAHAEVATMLSQAIDSIYHSQDAKRPIGLGPYSVTNESLRNASEELEMWSRTCPILAQSPENMSRAQLFLEYTYYYSQILLYSPFVHHMATSSSSTSSPQYTYGKQCFEAAIKSVQVAELLHKQLHFNEAYFFTIDVLTFAAMVLLVAEVGCADAQLAIEAMRAGRIAKELLLVLSLHSTTAAECWSALSVCGHTAQGSSMNNLSFVSSQPNASTSDYSSPVSPGHGLIDDMSKALDRPQPRMVHWDSAIDLDMSANRNFNMNGHMTTADGMDPTLSMPHSLACNFEHQPGTN